MYFRKTHSKVQLDLEHVRISERSEVKARKGNIDIELIKKRLRSAYRKKNTSKMIMKQRGEMTSSAKNLSRDRSTIHQDPAGKTYTSNEQFAK
jgi:hypothetical protein